MDRLTLEVVAANQPYRAVLYRLEGNMMFVAHAACLTRRSECGSKREPLRLATKSATSVGARCMRHSQAAQCAHIPLEWEDTWTA